MGFSRVEQSVSGTFAFGGAGSWGTVSDAGTSYAPATAGCTSVGVTAVQTMGASGGSYQRNATAGCTCTVTVPSGTTAVMFLGTGRNDGGAVTATLDGAAVPGWSWNQSNGTTNASAYWYLYALLSPPIVVNPATGHTIVLTGGASGMNIDAAEFYSVSAPTVGRFLNAGHSIAGGVNTTGSGPNPYTDRYSQLVTAWFGTTEFNTAVSGATLGCNDITASGSNPPMPMWHNCYVDTSLWAQTTPQRSMFMIGINDLNGCVTGPSEVEPTAGYCLNRYGRRLRELIWRMNYAVPACRVYAIGWTPETSQTLATVRAWTAAMEAACRDPYSTNARYIDILSAFVGAGWVQAGAAWLIAPDGVHPVENGHFVMAQTMYRQMVGYEASAAGQIGLGPF